MDDEIKWIWSNDTGLVYVSSIHGIRVFWRDGRPSDRVETINRALSMIDYKLSTITIEGEERYDD